MTILNVLRTDSRIYLAQDTAIRYVQNRGQEASISKVMHLPHINVVMGCRGPTGFALTLFNSFLDEALADFDCVDEWMSKHLDARQEMFVSWLTSAVPDIEVSSLLDGELIIAGHSKRLDRMSAVRFHKLSPMATFERIELNSGHISPVIEFLEPPILNTLEGMMALARNQFRRWSVEAPDEGFGGMLVYVELDKDSAAFTVQDAFS